MELENSRRFGRALSHARGLSRCGGHMVASFVVRD